MPTPRGIAFRVLPRIAALTLGAALLGVATSARAAVLRYPLATAATTAAGPVLARDRMVLKLRPDVAHAAYAEFARRGATALRGDATPTALASLRQVLAGARIVPEFPGESPDATPDLTTFWIARLDSRLPLASALDAAALAPEVESAEPIAWVPVADAVTAVDAGAAVPPAPPAAASPFSLAAAPPPNDSLWSLCYWLQQSSRRDLHVLEAWETTRGTDRDIIAILDTGILRWHPDLSGTTPGDWGALWTNAAERDGAPGVDDDGNGFVDDVWGWDFVDLPSDTLVRAGEDWRDEDNDPVDFAVHGTAVAGVAVAHADNVSGTPGVAPGARVMALRVGFSGFYQPAGLIDESAAARAIVYAVRQGATVINCSFSSVNQTDLAAAAQTAIDAGVLIVVAAGNNGSTWFLGGLEETISVTASDQNDKITLFANRGGWVDVTAPGQSIATTTLHATGTDSVGLRTPTYSRAEAGTSFSTPMMSAAAAMMQSDRRARGLAPYNWSLALLRLSETCDDISSVNTGDGYGYGRLNVQRLLRDPVRSRGSYVGATSIGPPVVFADAPNPSVAVCAMTSGELLFVRATTGDTIRRVPLGAMPTGGIAMADLGPGAGKGLFVGLADGRLAGFDSTGSALPGWPVAATGATGGEAMAAIADLDGDGFREVVWGGNDGRVYAWERDGTPMPGFPRTLDDPGANIRVALAPINVCGGIDIVATTGGPKLFAIDGTGGDIPGWPLNTLNPLGPPIVAHLDGEASSTVIVGTGRVVRAYSPLGQLLWTAQLNMGFVAGDLAAGDLDGDGFDEVVCRTENEDNLVVLNRYGVVLRWRHFGNPDGPLLIGPMAAGTGPQIAIGNADLLGRYRVLAFDATLVPLAGWPRVGFGSAHPVLADVDGDARTDVLAGAGPEHVSYVYDAGPATWRPEAAFWPTARGDDARTSSRIRPPLAPSQLLPPATIGDLRASVINTRSMNVQWTAPAHSGSYPRAIAYDFRIATQPITESNFSSATALFPGRIPALPGTTENAQLTGLHESQGYWIAIRSRNACGHWSPISNVLAESTLTVPPAQVVSLSVFAEADSAVTLYWIASGDDGISGFANRYLIHLSEQPLDEENFDNAPFAYVKTSTAFPGQVESVVLRELPAGRHLYAGLRAVDAAGNQSNLSNTIDFDVPGGDGVPPPADPTPPGFRVVSPVRSPVAFAWHGVADGASGQRITIFDATGRLWATIPLSGPGGVARWTGRGPAGMAGSGVYFARFVSGGFEQRARFILLR